MYYRRTYSLSPTLTLSLKVSRKQAKVKEEEEEEEEEEERKRGDKERKKERKNSVSTWHRYGAHNPQCTIDHGASVRSLAFQCNRTGTIFVLIT